MPAKPLVHPERDRLVAFGLGKLDQSEASQIESHLAECPDCCETLYDLKDDTFVALLRECAEPPATSSAARSEDVSARSDAGTCDDRDGAPALPPELVDHPRYRIVELIGKGGMGTVYKAEHRLMNRIVALKVINQKLFRHADAVARFRREAQSAARLTHPNIVTAYDAERAGEVHYLVMEYVDGTDLAQLVKQNGRLDVRAACDYVRQAAAGLQYAHDKQMIHRDVKPHNLIVTKAGCVKILDFGLATLATPLSEDNSIIDEGEQRVREDCDPSSAPAPLTALGALMGTPDFISPEQAGDSRRVDIRSDIYSLGCTLYYLLAGGVPFDQGMARDKLRAHAVEEPEPIENIRPDVAPELAAIVRRMMAKDPSARYQTPADVEAALTPFVAERGRDANLLAPAPTTAADGARKRLPPTRWILAAGMGAGLVAAAAIFFLQMQKTAISFEIDDPNLAISFGKDSVTIKDKDRQFTVVPSTEQRFVVQENGKDLETDTFTLSRGQKVVLRIKRVDGRVSVTPSDRSVSIDKSSVTSSTVDAWVKRVKGLREHMQAAFVTGAELVQLDPDKGLEIVRKAWPQITNPDVKTGLLKAFAFSKPLQPKKHSKLLQVLHLGMTDTDPKVRAYAAAYLREYAMEDFSEEPEHYPAWYQKYGKMTPQEVVQSNQSRVPNDLSEKLRAIEVAMNSGNVSRACEYAEKLAESRHPAVIPTFIGMIDADNSYDTVYGVGYFGLSRITGVDYSPYHDGAWWRRWWAKNKSQYPPAVQKLEIPALTKTKHGESYQPFPEDLDTLEGLLRRFEQLNARSWSDVFNWVQEVAKHKDPAAIPFLIGIIEADNSQSSVRDIDRGLSELTGVDNSPYHDGAWWRKWWEKNKSKYPAKVQAIPIPDLRAQLTGMKQAQRKAATDDALKDVADIPAKDLQAAGDKNKRYFLIGPRDAAQAPAPGFKLVIVLPGGAGGADFHPFVRRLYKNALGNDYLVAQPVAFKWQPNQQIVWPTRNNPVTGQKFATEDFVEAIVRDVSARHKLDKSSIFTLSWSSSGPAAYAMALAKDTPVTGSYVAMSVFRPELLPALEGARGRAFYIEHSPADQVCPIAMAEQAKESLEKAGATVRFNSYDGGHGWHGDIYGRVRSGIEWLEKNTSRGK